ATYTRDQTRHPGDPAESRGAVGPAPTTSRERLESGGYRNAARRAPRQWPPPRRARTRGDQSRDPAGPTRGGGRSGIDRRRWPGPTARAHRSRSASGGAAPLPAAGDRDFVRGPNALYRERPSEL